MTTLDNIDLNETLRELKTVLEEKFLPKLREDATEVRDRLAVIAQDVVRYWTLAQTEGPDGLRAKENLEWIKSEMGLLYATYAVKTSSLAKQVAIAWIEILARIGGTLLRSIILKGV